MINLYTELDRQLAAGKRTVLARIIRQVGSAPRTVGTKLIICEDGSIKGTIGGGSLEYQVIAKSKTIFQEGRSEIFHFRMTGEELAASQMLCGGIVDIFLEPIFPQNEMLSELMHHICILISEGRKGVLITRVSEGVEFNDAKCRILVLDDGTTVGDLPGKYRPNKDLIQQWQEFDKPALLGSEQEGDAGMVFVEPIESEAVLFLFGAGHISTFVAPLAKMVGFRVAVIDDRQDFLNAERFAHADELIVCPFTEAFESLTINGTSYIAVITRGHMHDRDVLREALKTDAAYIGMVGSLRKRRIIYQSLMDEGVPKARLEQVFSPIGLEIGAQTPEEIAVSIAAELVQVRAGQGVRKPSF